MATLEPAQYLAAVRTESANLRRAAEQAGLDAPVPSCPDWDVAALLAHMGRTHRWAAACIEADAFVAPGDLPRPPGRDELDRWVRDGADHLLDVLDRAPDTPAWTWAPAGTVGFWQRRQAHETAVHRVDAELAAGDPTPIPGDLAADGIDEWLALLPSRRGVPPPTGHGETVHLHCTDRAGEWLVRLTGDGPEIERVHAKGDVAVRGSASDLLLVVLRRLPPDRVEVLGEPPVLEAFLAQAGF
jgi:uncharacterized protein (TIGR03083 family)